MARQEHDREDLLREATALVRRAEYVACADEHDIIVIGFRRDGGMSVYIGADRAYHFHSAGTLRRAFVNGSLIKAEQGKLIRMTRHRTETQSQLISTPLTADEQAAFAAEGNLFIQRVLSDMQEDLYRLAEQVPADDTSLTDEILIRLRALCGSWTIADRPHVG